MFPKKDMLFSLLCMNKTFEKFVLWGLKKKDENKMHILYNVSGCNSGGVNPTTRTVLGTLLLKWAQCVPYTKSIMSQYISYNQVMKGV